MAAKSMSNFCYDNPELRESKIKKSSSKIDYADDDMEVWLFQCPKNVDPNQLLSCELAKMGKKTSGPKLECYADRYDEKKTLAVISPMKAAEYEMVCDNIQLVS